MAETNTTTTNTETPAPETTKVASIEDTLKQENKELKKKLSAMQKDLTQVTSERDKALDLVQAYKQQQSQMQDYITGLQKRYTAISNFVKTSVETCHSGILLALEGTFEKGGDR